MFIGLKGEKTVMNAAQSKDEIRKLIRNDKIEIYRWIDREVTEDLFYRIGMSRSIELRQQMEQKCKITSPKRRVHIGYSEQGSVGYSAQPTRVADPWHWHTPQVEDDHSFRATFDHQTHCYPKYSA